MCEIMGALFRLVLLRHGQSIYNEERRFTGWEDVNLTGQGCKEARLAGQLLRSEGFSFDRAFTSLLRRAIKTLWMVQDEMDMCWIPVNKSWHLNERHYGALQGLSGAEAVSKYGIDNVRMWMRSYDQMPPPLMPGDLRHPGMDRRYLNLPALPASESLFCARSRLEPFWRDSIAPAISREENVLICSHGNLIRTLLSILEGLPIERLSSLVVPTGIPIVCELNDDLLLTRRYNL